MCRLGALAFCLVSRCCLCPPDSASRNGTKRKQPADGRRSGVVAKCREVKRSRTGRTQALNSEWRGSLRVSAGFGETSGAARCGKPQSADDPISLNKSHFPFRNRKGRAALKPSATCEVSRGAAFGGWGVGRKSLPHIKTNEAETLAGSNLGALRLLVSWVTRAISKPRPNAKAPCSISRFHQDRQRRVCAGNACRQSCGGKNLSIHPGSDFPARD